MCVPDILEIGVGYWQHFHTGNISHVPTRRGGLWTSRPTNSPHRGRARCPNAPLCNAPHKNRARSRRRGGRRGGRLRLARLAPPLALLLRPLTARSCGAGEAEAAVPVAAAGIDPGAAGGTAVPREVVPAAAAQDTAAARSRTRRISHAAAGICSSPIAAPLPYVPVHIVKAPCVRSLLPDRMRFGTAITVIPPHGTEIARPGKRAGRPCTAGVFPFRFRWQTRFSAELAFRFRIHLADELLAVVPRNVFHRQIVAREM